MEDMKIPSRLLEIGREKELINMLNEPMNYMQTQEYIARKVQEADPVYYAMYCALIIPLALYMWQNERKRWNGCVLGLNIAAAFLTESRGTIVVLLALLLVFILITDKKTRNKILCAGCVIACLAVFVSFAVPTVSQQFTNIIKSVIIESI